MVAAERSRGPPEQKLCYSGVVREPALARKSQRGLGVVTNEIRFAAQVVEAGRLYPRAGQAVLEPGSARKRERRPDPLERPIGISQAPECQSSPIVRGDRWMLAEVRSERVLLS